MTEAMMTVLVYKDTTGWYDDEYFEDWSHDNLIELDFPVRIVQKWFNEHEPFYYAEFDPSDRECPYCRRSVTDFWEWYREWYDVDDTDGLFDFSVKNGFTPEKPKDYLENL